MSTRRAEQISHIIEGRKPLAARSESVQHQLTTLAAAITALENQRDQILHVGNAEIVGRLRAIDFSPARSKIAAELETLERMKRRFARETLNIGVVGRRQQGKSRLLQSLSGSGPTEIPDGPPPACTGVRNTISHNPDVLPYGDVWFYTARAFLKEVVAPYYHLLRFSPPPERLDEFAGKPLPPLPDNLPIGKEHAQAAYDHLKRCRQALEKQYQLLTTPSPRRVPLEELRSYITKGQTDGTQSNTAYLVVREAKTVCTFPFTDTGQIALVDLPGFDMHEPDEWERLLPLLPYDTDMLLLVRMPAAEGDEWGEEDLQWYNLLRSALSDLPLNRWVFAVLNQTHSHTSNGDNTAACHHLRDTLATAGGGSIEVIDCLIANGASPAETRQVVLDTVLAYLEEHMASLDEWLLLSCEDRLLSLQHEIRAGLEKARPALGVAPATTSEFPLFQRLFRNVWDNLTTGLERLLKELNEQRTSENRIFQEDTERVLEACRDESVLPSLDAIETRRDRTGSYEIAYKEYLHELRTHLTRNLVLLDGGLHLVSEAIKERVVEVLIESGRMGTLTPARGVEFLNAMGEGMLRGYDNLQAAFHTLATFDLSYREFVQYRIRRSLDELTPDLTSLALSSRPSAQEVLECLRTLYHETLYRLRIALTSWLSEPNEAAFAIAEEFTDQALRARDVREDWERFYYEVRAEVWATEFQKFGERSHIRKQWREAIERVEEALTHLQLPEGDKPL
jgi:hypothetical protein